MDEYLGQRFCCEIKLALDNLVSLQDFVLVPIQLPHLLLNHFNLVNQILIAAFAVVVPAIFFLHVVDQLHVGERVLVHFDVGNHVLVPLEVFLAQLEQILLVGAVGANECLQLGQQVAVVGQYLLAIGDGVVDGDDQILTEYFMVVG